MSSCVPAQRQHCNPQFDRPNYFKRKTIVSPCIAYLGVVQSQSHRPGSERCSPSSWGDLQSPANVHQPHAFRPAWSHLLLMNYRLIVLLCSEGFLHARYRHELCQISRVIDRLNNTTFSSAKTIFFVLRYDFSPRTMISQMRWIVNGTLRQGKESLFCISCRTYPVKLLRPERIRPRYCSNCACESG